MQTIWRKQLSSKEGKEGHRLSKLVASLEQRRSCRRLSATHTHVSATGHGGQNQYYRGNRLPTERRGRLQHSGAGWRRYRPGRWRSIARCSPRSRDSHLWLPDQAFAFEPARCDKYRRGASADGKETKVTKDLTVDVEVLVPVEGEKSKGKVRRTITHRLSATNAAGAYFRQRSWLQSVTFVSPSSTFVVNCLWGY